MCVTWSLFWFDCKGRWWQQKQPYLLCSSGLALAGTWTYQNVWVKSFFWAIEDVLVALLWVFQYVWAKRVLPVCCFGMFWSGLIVKAVDDNKNNLTYFVRVDWHLPERELTKKSEANLFLEHLKTCLLPCCENMSEKCVLPVSCFECFGVVWLWRLLMTTKTTLPTLFEWTGTCRNVNLPKSLRQIFSWSTWRRACCLVVSISR